MPSAEAAVVKTEDLVGGWVGDLPCPLRSAELSAGNPMTVRFECVSGTTWDGDWVDYTVYRAVGVLDVVSGDSRTALDEALTGLLAATRAVGTPHRVGTVEVVAATGAVIERERMVGGTGAFAGSSGTVMSVGNQVGPVSGRGGYQGTWTLR